MPSIEQIEQMERQRSQALDAVEILDSGHSVKCQRCGVAVPIVGKMSRPKNDDVVKLQTCVKWMEKHPHICNKEDLEATKRELAKMLKEEATYEKLRSIPLQYWRGKYCCGRCLDKLIVRAR